MTIDKDKKYLVCLIDIMGQSQLFDDISKLNDQRYYDPENFTEKDISLFEEKIKQVESISDYIINLKNIFKAEFDLMKNKEKVEEIINIFSNLYKQKVENPNNIASIVCSEIASLQFNIQQFSDTIIIYIEMPTDFKLITVVVSSWFFILSKMMIFSFARGISLRGAVSYDLG